MKRFTVYIGSAYGVKHILFEARNREEAHNYCAKRNWCYYDENNFAWDLDYTE